MQQESVSLMILSKHISNHSRCISSLLAKGMELNEDDRILDHGAQRSDQPRQIRENVFALEGMEEDL